MTTPAVFALTRGGAELAARIARLLPGEAFLPETLEDSGALGEAPRFPKVGPALRTEFASGRPLICVMATGVVVRSLAETLGDKRTDPPVLVVDEAGRFVIPLLGGHLGGANALALRLADLLDAQPVLTTSSDVQGLLGPDLLAERLDAAVLEPARLTDAASALVNGEAVELRYDPEDVGGAEAFLEALDGYRALPSEAAGATDAFVIEIAVRRRTPDTPTTDLTFVPRWVRAGVGCKRGIATEHVLEALRESFEAARLQPAALGGIASVEAKADEEGLLAAAETLAVPVEFVSPAELEEVIQREALEENDFVRDNVGVGAVSEPAALWAAGEGARLLSPKRAGGGVTVALALEDGARVLERTARGATHTPSVAGGRS